MRDTNWAGPVAHRASHRWQAGPGRWKRRELTAVAVPHADWLPLPGGRQVFRIQHCTRQTRLGPTPTETLDGFPNWGPEQASALRNLALALLLPSGRGETLPLAQARCSVRRAEALLATQ